jgi:hypothetical protein
MINTKYKIQRSFIMRRRFASKAANEGNAITIRKKEAFTLNMQI